MEIVVKDTNSYIVLWLHFSPPWKLTANFSPGWSTSKLKQVIPLSRWVKFSRCPLKYSSSFDIKRCWEISTRNASNSFTWLCHQMLRMTTLREVFIKIVGQNLGVRAPWKIFPSIDNVRDIASWVNGVISSYVWLSSHDMPDSIAKIWVWRRGTIFSNCNAPLFHAFCKVKFASLLFQH